MKIVANDYEAKDILKIIREWTGLTQKEFGKAIDRSERTMQNLEAGISNYSFKTLLEVAKKHNIEIVISKNDK